MTKTDKLSKKIRQARVEAALSQEKRSLSRLEKSLTQEIMKMVTKVSLLIKIWKLKWSAQLKKVAH